MKKQLLFFSFFLGASLSVNAQILQSDNFNALNNGNVTTNIAGTLAGQGGYFLQSENGAAPTTSTNAAATNAQIVASDATNVKALRLEGPNGNGGGRFLFKDFTVGWASRTAGNNIIEVEVDINPGVISTSRNTFGIYIYNSAYNKVLAGFVVRAATRELSLVAYSTPQGQAVNNYTYSLAPAPGVILPANQLSRIGISYDTVTGEVTIKGPGIPAEGVGVLSSALSTDVPAEVDFISFSGSTTALPNTAAATMTFDNFVVRASATDTLLGVDDVATIENAFLVYPNPVKDFVTISNSVNSIENISIIDLNGRTVKSVKLNGETSAQVNISDLSAGVYMMNINSDQGSVTKKIVKN